MDPIEVTATAVVMIAARPGGKPTPHVVTAAYADELITALCAAKTACVAGQAALEAATTALAGRHDDDGDVAEATCGAVAPHSGVPCSLPEHDRQVRHEHQREGRPAIVWDADTWVSADPADGETSASHAAEVADIESIDATAAMFARAGVEPVIVPPDPGWRDPVTGLTSGPIYDHLNRLSCGCTFAGPITWPAGRKARCDSHGEVTTVAIAEPDEPMPVAYLPLRRPRIGAPA